jgi:hypothetical protein
MADGSVVQEPKEGSFNRRDFRVESGLDRSERLTILSQGFISALGILEDEPFHSGGLPAGPIRSSVYRVQWEGGRGPRCMIPG